MMPSRVLLILCCIFLNFYSSYACQWPYLNASSFKERQKIALEFIQGCDTIIEIGGAQTPISQFAKDKNIIVIDPEIKRKQEDKILHLPINFQDWDGSFDNKNYAVIILGLDLVMHDAAWRKLFTLIDNSKKTVIEFSTEYKKAKKQYKTICKNITKKTSQEIELDFSAENFRKYTTVYPYRKICLLE